MYPWADLRCSISHQERASLACPSAPISDDSWILRFSSQPLRSTTSSSRTPEKGCSSVARQRGAPHQSDFTPFGVFPRPERALDLGLGAMEIHPDPRDLPGAGQCFHRRHPALCSEPDGAGYYPMHHRAGSTDARVRADGRAWRLRSAPPWRPRRNTLRRSPAARTAVTAPAPAGVPRSSPGGTVLPVVELVRHRANVPGARSGSGPGGPTACPPAT